MRLKIFRLKEQRSLRLDGKMEQGRRDGRGTDAKGGCFRAAGQL
ncbi:hypothetical protein B4113_0700 [Geobacillus sp. B4113_201601]|nr:hypothetical protein B4113_0700 [Geobacillus sp. B4113_201601]